MTIERYTELTGLHQIELGGRFYFCARREPEELNVGWRTRRIAFNRISNDLRVVLWDSEMSGDVAIGSDNKFVYLYAMTEKGWTFLADEVPEYLS